MADPHDSPSALETSRPPTVTPSEDLARGLFTKNHAMASVVRELQKRNMRAQKGHGGQDGAPCDENDEEKPCGEGNIVALPVPDVEQGNGLWVLGGATTVADCQGAVPDKHGKFLIEDVPLESVPEAAVIAAPVVPAPMCKEKETVVPCQQPGGKGRIRRYFGSLLEGCKATADIVRLYPGTLIIPLMFFMLLCGLGTWGVIAGAEAHVQQRKDDARSRAVDAATGLKIQLQQAYTPGLTFTLLVRQRPDFEYWIENFNHTAQEMLTRVPNGALYNLQLQPYAQVAMIYPFIEKDRSQVQPPRDLLGDPARGADILRIIRTREAGLVGPFALTNGEIGAFVRYPIFISNVDANETFNYKYIFYGANNTARLTYEELPASVLSCTICYNATRREKWWGLMSVAISFTAVTQAQDAYLSNLRNMGFHYALVRPINATDEQVIAQVGPTSLRYMDAVTVDVQVVDRNWMLRVAPSGGFEPNWKGPLIAAVVIIAIIMSVLLFVAIASFRRHLVLLKETVRANQELEETTKRLEEEKERMDVLLVRQYDLLRCLDANRGDKMDTADAFGASKKAMMARIEDARRSLNVAKASVEDSVQVFEVLGAGAFGKVQKGLWRGTVVAVKTMILPANMTGQQKREKMAVMEAAISSSLVHPNIVTTYTYFIRPYHEPTHDGVQQMLVSRSPNSSANGSNNSLEDSAGTEITIHSYEVRLVLEFCDKGSLKDALDQHAFMQGGSLNLSAMLETAADVAKAMVHMHAANVLHSDLKARNIMLKSSGMDGRGVIAKVADFGLSTRMEHQETHLSSCFQGTLTHMAPEVMLEGRISKAADVYSFGILMWELFCAGDPFAGVPRAHIGHAITKEARRPKFPPFAPRDYVSLASRCWDPDASLRPTFEEVLSELVRMREELGGDTPQLVIAPPRPLSPHSSGNNVISPKGSGGQRGEAAGHLYAADGSASSGVTLGSGGATTLLGAGIVLGGGGSTTLNSNGGGLMSSLDGSSKSSLAQRARLKSLLAQRQLRKMGIRLGGGGTTAMLTQALPALHEEAEHKEAEAPPTTAETDPAGSPAAASALPPEGPSPDAPLTL